jgi:hypothetical protein
MAVASIVDDKSQAAIFAYSSTAMPRLAGTLVTVAAFVCRIHPAGADRARRSHESAAATVLMSSE